MGIEQQVGRTPAWRELHFETMRCTGDELRVEHPSLADGVGVPQATAVLNSYEENASMGSPKAFKAEGRGRAQ